MEERTRPVDVISLCSAEGEIRPLRLQVEDEEKQLLRVDIEDVVSVNEIPHIGIEAHVFLCWGRIHGRRRLLELRYTFRSHSWELLRIVN